MSVENTETAEGSEPETKPINGDQERLNGLSNGHIESSSSKHKSSSKDKHRDKDRDRDKDKDYKSSKSSSSRDKDSDKHKSSSSSSKDKYRDKERDKDRDKEKDRHKSSSSHKSSSRDKDRERDKDKERSKDKDREKDKERDKDKDKDREKEKEKIRDKDKEKSRDNEKRESDKEKEKRKDHKSSSHSKDKERDKEKSESSKDRDKEKDRHRSSKDKHSSSSSKSRDKDKHSSSRDKDRHRDKDREKRDKSEKENSVENNTEQIKPEIKEDIKLVVDIPRNDYDQSCSGFPFKDDTYIKPINHNKEGFETKMKEEPSFNISQASSCDYSMSQFREDEPSFQIKAELTDEEENVENEKTEVNKTQQVQQNGENQADEDDELDDVPLIKRKAVAADSDDDVPLLTRKKLRIEKQGGKVEKKAKKAKKKKREEAEDDLIDEKPKKKKVKKEKQQIQQVKTESPTKGRKKKEEEPEDVWRWWEEEKRDDGVKWRYLEHKGPVFAPEYTPLPAEVKFYYDGKHIRLSQDAEEVATFYAKMLTHDYVTKDVFNNNFFKDWRKTMTSKEKDTIKDLKKCNFKEMNDYFTAQSEKNKNRTKDEKLALKESNEKLIQEYGFCTIDGHKERIGNFKLEPPGLFRGRGEHPKMGMVKRRIMPEDVLVNCSKDSHVPDPPPGHKWREVRHDNTVTWLASWTENVQGQVKYIMLNPSSKLKGEKDYQKYEVARRLDKHVDKIRTTYRDEWKSKEMRIRQRGVALYFIDKLALRAGNEKDEDQADTVGCCSLRVEHVTLHKELNGKENVVIFDFLGKDSIRYYNEVEVEKRVFKNLELFMENKKEGDDLFDRLNTAVLNEHLKDLMEGLTAKVFRTYNASITLQKQLDLLTDPDASVVEKLLSYNRANRAVAVLCNHQRAVPKSHAKSMENLKEKIKQKRELIDDAESELYDLKKQAKRGSVKEKILADKKSKQLEKLKEQLKKLELQETDRDENKTIALGTSKLNYLDPRISVAWCKKFDVPIEKIFNKTQRDKFRWAIHMADENYRF